MFVKDGDGRMTRVMAGFIRRLEHYMHEYVHYLSDVISLK